MNGGVFTPCDKSKVFNAVVSFVAVDVVDKIAFRHRAVVLFPNIDVHTLDFLGGNGADPITLT